jgi:hypothetical protein
MTIKTYINTGQKGCHISKYNQTCLKGQPQYNKSLSIKDSLIFPLINSAYNFYAITFYTQINISVISLSSRSIVLYIHPGQYICN